MNTLTKASKTFSEFHLLELFEDFLSFWKSLREKIELHYNDGIDLTTAEGNKIDNVPRFIQSQLLLFAEQQQKQVDIIATPIQQEFYQKLLYAIAALIDEQLLQQVKWKEEKQWLRLMLELSLFGSRNSGEKLIVQMQDFSQLSHVFGNDEKELAGCYLRVLWLGFDGKFADNPETLTQLKTQLISNAELTIPDLSVKTIFPQAYIHNIINGEQSRLAPISRWQRFIVLGIGAYLSIAGIIWLTLTYHLEDVLIS